MDEQEFFEALRRSLLEYCDPSCDVELIAELHKATTSSHLFCAMSDYGFDVASLVGHILKAYGIVPSFPLDIPLSGWST